ncbi:hypothetical protein [Streptomyces sp. BH055]|uniref:hypothetical protein n=1 Tax=Streptomyces sp. BH055 TaxID=3401173 RepID=UPI003BB6C80C
MGFVPEQGAVEEFAAQAANPAFHDWDHACRADGGEHGADPGLGEDLVDGGGVFRVAVAGHELDGGELPGVFGIRDRVLDCLGDPGVGGVCGGAEYADGSVGVVDGGEGVLRLPGEGDGLDEVHCEYGFGLGAQECGPGDV